MSWSSASTRHRVARRAGRACRPVVAAEPRAGYEAAATPRATNAATATAATATAGAGRDQLPVLDEVPRLAAVLDDLAVVDDRSLSAVAGLARLLASDEVERTTGVGPEHWLASVARQTRMDRRLLVRACRLLHRLPALADAVERRRISFAQLRGLTLALRTAPRELDGAVDGLLAAVLDGLESLDRPDPDAVIRQVADGLVELTEQELEQQEDAAHQERWLALQPRLDGTGGRVTGEVDAVGLAVLAAATTPDGAQLAASGSYGAARLDLLLARVAGAVAPSDVAVGPAGELDLRATPAGTTSSGTAAVTDAAHRAAGAPLPATVLPGGMAPPQLLLRMPLDALLGGSVPADLLTSLVGGRLRVTSTTARRLVDEAGVQLRTIVIDDDGAVVGVGRSTRRPPGWLRDAVLAVHDTCSGPGCDRPALGADLDHATPWVPDRPGAPPGTTDVDQLGPLCPSTNRDRHAAGWEVVQRRDGVRTWRHARSGLTSTTVPSTWRPPGERGPATGRRRPPRRPPGAPAPGDEDLPF